ncbi:hypothetical protein B0J13DRAFT_595692 [Dactylonectria estremocensis]|uniref:Uncharacterized protein n=1 Tax=Dactylonectria estremocensis TaxID=1079267 RepID=A0A9P9ETK5_9HYPO|nr:hypothetical protein B0J13DRAFT_595692 [Dactylonectria estremocensis]
MITFSSPGLLPRRAIAANTIPFTPVQTLSPEQSASIDQEGGRLDFDNWVNRGMTMRKGDSRAEYNGAAGALSLLPTAGALLGAPTREMWIVYKLVPLAGLLSMFLSLSGSITPSNVGEYDPAEPFSYSGFMPTTRITAARRGPTSRRFILIISLLIPIWYTQRGQLLRSGVAWGWIYFWYFLVSAVSIFDNLVATPFTCSWPNINQRIRIAIDKGSGYSRTCFYVVISIQGISRLHAIAQILSKASSVAVFAFRTTLFASATLMSISIALMVLCLLLGCGVAGRPILHKLVKSENEAGEYIHAIASLLTTRDPRSYDYKRVVYQVANVLFSAATYIGLLAKPFDAIALAEKATQGGRRSTVARIRSNDGAHSHASGFREQLKDVGRGYIIGLLSAF